MESGRRCRRRAELFAVYRLIARLIAKLFGDIRRKRHLTYLIKNIEKITLVLKPCKSVSALKNFQHLAFKLSVSESETRAGFSLFAGTGYDLPDIIAAVDKQQKFNVCAGFLLNAV